jgi:hypothetical protein
MFGAAMVNVPKDFQDYEDDDETIERRRSRMEYWKSLKKLRLEFLNETETTEYDAIKFLAWVENRYGFRPKLFESYITDDLEIVDQKKYLMYLLKYG